MAYGVSSLPADGLAAMEQSLGLSLQSEISHCYNIVLQKIISSNNDADHSAQYNDNNQMQEGKGGELFDVYFEGLAQFWLKYPGAIHESMSNEQRNCLFELIS